MFVAAFVYSVLALSIAASSPTTSAPIATHTISVGGADGLNYSPKEISNVPVGDIIEFRFYPLNHSVARAAFGPQPCIPYEYSADGRVGFWSGFRPTSLVLNDPPIFRLRINDTEPVFFYCSSPFACQEGMIGVINPNATFSFDAQFNYTQKATMSFSPDEAFPVEQAPPVRTTTATGAPAGATNIPGSAGTTNPTTSSSSIGIGPIAGIAIGGFALIVLVIALVYMCGRQKTITEILNRQSIGNNSYARSGLGGSEGGGYIHLEDTPKSAYGARFSSGHGSTQGAGIDTYRSMTPPVDERTGFIGDQGQMSGFEHVLSPKSIALASPGFEGPQEMESPHTTTGSRPRGQPPFPPQQPIDEGPHEMPAPVALRSSNFEPGNFGLGRAFSYIEGEEAGFRGESRSSRHDTKGDEDEY